MNTNATDMGLAYAALEAPRSNRLRRRYRVRRAWPSNPQARLTEDDRREHILRRSRSTIEGCWFWEGPTTTDGRYGKYDVPGVGQLAHRVSYILFRGPIPEGLTLDHLCGVSRCVNPAHLEPVTLQENIRRSDNICARESRQTHCKRGHEFTPENTYPYKNGRRGCRTCISNARKRRWRELGT